MAQIPPIMLRANELNEQGKFAEAGQLYDQILTQNPENPWVLATMATVLLRDSKTLGLGTSVLHSALKNLKPSDAPPDEILINLGCAYKYSGQPEKAKHWFERALNQNPTHVGALSNYGSMYTETAEPERGLPLLERALKHAPDLPIAHWNLALCLLGCAREKDHWGRAWEEYEWGLEQGGMRVKKRLVPLPYWKGERGLKVMAHGEQGIGDEIMFASMIPELARDCDVILDAHPRLTTLFAKSFGLKCYGTRKEETMDWLEEEKPDAMVSLASLGKFYRRANSDFPRKPYLKAEPLLPKAERLRIGISWTGGRRSDHIMRRTVPLSWWKPILEQNAEFVSLQYTEGCEAEIGILRAKFGLNVTEHPAAKATDYYETAQLVASCDLVISVCTSVIHLAGALGVPTWVMVPRNAAWRYQSAGPNPWYGCVRHYRQPVQDENAWIPVVNRVAFDLDRMLLEGRKRNAA